MFSSLVEILEDELEWRTAMRLRLYVYNLACSGIVLVLRRTGPVAVAEEPPTPSVALRCQRYGWKARDSSPRMLSWVVVIMPFICPKTALWFSATK